MLAQTPAQYRGPGDAASQILASGLRNSQGPDWQPGTARLIANDHGPNGFDGSEGYDEINAIVSGGIYGWPEVIGNDTGGGRFIAPLRLHLAPIVHPSVVQTARRPGRANRRDAS
jgi:glucose/arabinose dehydrogenase